MKRKSPLTLEEKKQLQPFVSHLTGVVSTSQFQSKNLSTCIHSLTSSQLLYLSVRIDDRDLAEDIETLTKALLSKVAKVRNFDSQGVANVLWALGRLVDNGLNQEETTDAVMALLPQVVHEAQETSPQAGLTSQGVANLIWGLAKLVGNGLNLKLVNDAVMELLPLVIQDANSHTEFVPQYVSNLLWALAKLVENGFSLEQANKAVTALLPLVAQGASPQAGFIPQHISNLLWALAKLVEYGFGLEQVNESLTALLPQVVQMAQGANHQAGFKPQEIANLLWSIAFFGECIKPQTIENVLTYFSFGEQYSVADQNQLLWSFMVFMARGVSMSDQLVLLMKFWYQDLAQQEMDKQFAPLLSIANIWLDIKPCFIPIYETRRTNLQIDFKAKLTDQFPDMQFSEEYSCANLPPLDLFIDGIQLGIEVQGPHHFIDQNSLLRTGRTILKVETYKKIKIKVIEVPYSDVDNDLDGKQLSWAWDILSKELNAIQPSQSLNPDDDSNHAANESQDESGDDSEEEYKTADEDH